jgi:MFS family permease
VDPARHQRDPGVPEGGRGAAGRARAGARGSQATAQAGDLVSSAAPVGAGAGFIVGTFIFTYATTVQGQSRNFVLTALITQTVIGFLWVVCAGALSDKIGRKNMYMIGAASMGIFGFIYFARLNTGIPWVIFVAIAISLVPVMTQYGPKAALIAESFSPRLRYSGTSIGYQLASIIAGGPARIIATWLFAAFHSSVPITLYILALAIIGIISTAMLTDYTGKDISAEYAGV